MSPVQVVLSRQDAAGDWIAQARRLLRAQTPPEAVIWSQEGANADLFADAPAPPETTNPTAAAPEETTEEAGVLRLLLLHAAPERFALAYRLCWRRRQTPGLLQMAGDRDVHKAQRMAQAVRRDMHKMKAFVRFRAVERDGETFFIAWFEPDHHIVAAVAPFFQRRFAAMKWSILTPSCSVHWDGRALTVAEGALRPATTHDDPVEAAWLVYYASIFNPARLKVAAMQSEMPKKYWKNLPEAALIPELIRGAAARTSDMIAAGAVVRVARPRRGGAG